MLCQSDLIRIRRRLSLLSGAFAFVLICASFAAAEQELPRFLSAARAQIGKTVRYDGSYQTLAYPGGDVPLERGVCTDVVVRAYRSIGLDLQKLLHEDMTKNFSAYPSRKTWGMTRPDASIDHRRVPNLQSFFARHGATLPIADDGASAQPGDLLTWRLPSGVPHIGIVSDRKAESGVHFLVIHNIGEGAKEEDVIGKFALTGRYRFGL